MSCIHSVLVASDLHQDYKGEIQSIYYGFSAVALLVISVGIGLLAYLYAHGKIPLTQGLVMGGAGITSIFILLASAVQCLRCYSYVQD